MVVAGPEIEPPAQLTHRRCTSAAKDVVYAKVLCPTYAFPANVIFGRPWLGAARAAYEENTPMVVLPHQSLSMFSQFGFALNQQE